MSHRILFIVPYPHDKAPSQRLKFEQYYEDFRRNGFEVTWSSFYSDEAWKVIYKKGRIAEKVKFILSGYLRRITDLFRLRQYDAVYVHLWVTPIGPPFFEWLYSKVARKMVYDIDDLIFLKDAGHIAGWKRLLKGRRKPIVLMKESDHVVTCTPYLDEFVRKYNSHTTDISSTINTETYIPVNQYKNDHKLVLGWSGSHSTAAYLYLLKDALLQLNAVIPFKLLVMGDRNFNIEGLDVEALDWSEEREIPTLQRIDIGLYPLPDEQWVLGKSGLKALQYMSLGIPTVATAIGANFRVMQDGESGFLVKTPEQWLEKLTYLMEHPEERARIGKNAAERVEALYSIHANAPVYRGILKDLIA